MYYLYILLDPRYPQNLEYQGITINFKPFYIGKGTKDRVLQHYHSLQDHNISKSMIIKELSSLGYQPEYVKLLYTDDENLAYQNEIQAIAYFSALGIELTNKTLGGDAPPKHLGKDNNKTHKVFQYNKNTGILIKEYESVTQAVSTNNFSKAALTHICGCCTGTRNTCEGFLWSYEKYTIYPNIPKKFQRIEFTKLIAYNDSERHEFKSMQEAYQFLNVPNKGKISSVLKGERNTYKGYYWCIE